MAEIIPFPERDGIVLVQADNGEFRVHVHNWAPLAHIDQRFTDGDDALKYALLLAERNGLYIAFKPLPQFRDSEVRR
ncbi:MAG: hypothetical protein ABJA20_09310 [Novosphingobium sp.]